MTPDQATLPQESRIMTLLLILQRHTRLVARAKQVKGDRCYIAFYTSCFLFGTSTNPLTLVICEMEVKPTILQKEGGMAKNSL